MSSLSPSSSHSKEGIFIEGNAIKTHNWFYKRLLIICYLGDIFTSWVLTRTIGTVCFSPVGLIQYWNCSIRLLFS